jgi:hypothetical protein
MSGALASAGSAPESAFCANSVWWAMQLAKDLETCRSLLAGEPVDPARIDCAWLQTAQAFELVRLDFAAIDLLHRRAELRRLIKETKA